MSEIFVQSRLDGLTVFCPGWRGIPGLIHGATTRAALPESGKDDLFRVVARAREAGALPLGLAIGADQVHGERIEAIVEPIEEKHGHEGLRCAADVPEKIRDKARTPNICEFAATDALLTTLPGVLLLIQTADCLPVFLVDPIARIAGLAHCGWRGLRLGLAGKLAEAMIAQGAMAGGLQAWLGPAICTAHYEVGRELVADFAGAFAGARVSPDGTHLDLAAVARWQLEEAGVAGRNIFESGECTQCQPERYHSYRRDGAQAGRILSFIGFEDGAE